MRRIITERTIFFDQLSKERELLKQSKIKLLIFGFTFLYMFANYFYLSSLRFISNTEAATYLATDPAVCFILAFCLLDARKNKMSKNVVHLIAAILSFAAIALSLYGGKVSEPESKNITGNATAEVSEPSGLNDHISGGVLAILATFGAAFYKTMFARYLATADTRQVSLILTLIGFLNLIIVLPISFFLIYFNYETIDLFSSPWGLMIAMSLAGVIFNFLINWGCVVTYPLFISVGISLCLPGNLIVDYFLRGNKFSQMQLAGTAFAFTAVVVLLAMQYYSTKVANRESQNEKYSAGVKLDDEKMDVS